MKLFMFGREGSGELVEAAAKAGSLDARWTIADSSVRELTWQMVDANVLSQGFAVTPVDDLFSAPLPGHLLTLWIDGADDGQSAEVLEQVGGLVPTGLAVQVEERVPLNGAIPTGGLCRFTLQVRRPDLSREEFWQHWTQVHAPLVISMGPGFVRYITNKIVAPDVPWDGTVEQWFPSVAAMAEHDRQVFNEKEAIRLDLPKFMSKIQQFTGTIVA
jgi:hypothetical protein